MKQIKVKCPKTLNDCTIEQIGSWIGILDALKVEDPNELLNNESLMVDVVSLFSGVRKSLVRQFEKIQLMKIYIDLINMLGRHEPTEPKGEVTIDGKKYVFHKDFKKITTGQVIDIKTIEVSYKEPSRLMAILYNEEGFTYGQTDENDQHLKPTKERSSLFAKKFPAEEYINCMAFFLENYEKRKLAFTMIQTVKMQMELEKMGNELKTEIQGERQRRTGFFGRNKSK